MNLEGGAWEFGGAFVWVYPVCSAMQKIVVGMCVCYRFLHGTLVIHKLTHRLTHKTYHLQYLV